MACLALSKIDKSQCDRSIGGVQKVWFGKKVDWDAVGTEASGVAPIFDDGASALTNVGTASTALLTSGSEKIFTFGIDKETSSMTSTMSFDNGSSYATTDLVLAIAKMSKEKSAAFNALAENELFCIVKDNNGKYWFLGHQVPVQMNAGTAQTGTAYTDKSGYDVTLQDAGFYFPPEIVDDSSEATHPNADFIAALESLV